MIYDPKSFWFKSWLVNGPLTRIAVDQNGVPKTAAAPKSVTGPAVRATSA